MKYLHFSLGVQTRLGSFWWLFTAPANQDPSIPGFRSNTEPATRLSAGGKLQKGSLNLSCHQIHSRWDKKTASGLWHQSLCWSWCYHRARQQKNWWPKHWLHFHGSMGTARPLQSITSVTKASGLNTRADQDTRNMPWPLFCPFTPRESWRAASWPQLHHLSNCSESLQPNRHQLVPSITRRRTLGSNRVHFPWKTIMATSQFWLF